MLGNIRRELITAVAASHSDGGIHWISAKYRKYICLSSFGHSNVKFVKGSLQWIETVNELMFTLTTVGVITVLYFIHCN